tara:strand:- start:41692 stop:42789 length:1098 start_codon:yes stop_codon:yes gene_type:complete
MESKVKVSVLGATGMVGQQFIQLLDNHPWFDVADVAASERSEGMKYSDAIKNSWVMEKEVPQGVRELIVRNVKDFDKIPKDVKCIFSAMDLPNKQDTRLLEFEYANSGFYLISNSSANRWTKDVPMIIPEINHDHTDIIPIQQKLRGFTNKGFVAVKPNCSIQSYITALYALEQAGFALNKVQVTTLQSLSGGGQALIQSKKMKNNVIPFINGEESKTEMEPLKIFGTINGSGIENTNRLVLSATCTRVPVKFGHLAVVNVNFKNKKPTLDKIKSIWENFKSFPQLENLPMSPQRPIVYIDQDDRPQPMLDNDSQKSMALTIGRLKKDNIFDIRFVSLSHNTVRGAAGGSILVGELLLKKGLINA